MTLADAIVPLALASQLRGHGGTGPVRNSPCGKRRVLLRAAYDDVMELTVVLKGRDAAGGTAVSYAGA